MDTKFKILSSDKNPFPNNHNYETSLTSNPFPGSPSFQSPQVPYRIKEIFEAAELILIRYVADSKTVFNANIYAYQKTGKLEWIIEPAFLDAELEDPYVYLGWSVKHKGITVQTFGGNFGLLDLETGVVNFIANYGR